MRAAETVDFVRAREWWVVKLAPLVGLAYAEVVLHDVAAGPAIALVFCMLASGAALAAFGHVVNDVFDVAADRHSGKQNPLARLSPPQRFCAAITLLGLAFAPWLLRPISSLPLLVLAFDAVLLFAYATPPLRLKARGLSGALTDAAYAHLVPVVFVVTLFSGSQPEPAWLEPLWISLLCAWSIAFGLRSILIHQLRDLDADAAAGISTLAVRAGKAPLQAWGSRFLYPAELLAMGGLVIATLLFAPLAGAFFIVLWLGGETARVLDWCPARGTGSVPAGAGAHVPQQLALAVWPALAFGTALTIDDPRFLVLLLLPILLFRWAVRSEIGYAVAAGRQASRAGIAALRSLGGRRILPWP